MGPSDCLSCAAQAFWKNGCFVRSAVGFRKPPAATCGSCDWRTDLAYCLIMNHFHLRHVWLVAAMSVLSQDWLLPASVYDLVGEL